MKAMPEKFIIDLPKIIDTCCRYVYTNNVPIAHILILKTLSAERMEYAKKKIQRSC